MSEHNAANRPSILNEVRAWLIVAGAVLIQLATSVWWAATLSAEIRNINTNIAEMKNNIFADHEARIRTLERKQ